jgi:hypothetical protein
MSDSVPDYMSQAKLSATPVASLTERAAARRRSRTISPKHPDRPQPSSGGPDQRADKNRKELPVTVKIKETEKRKLDVAFDAALK